MTPTPMQMAVRRPVALDRNLKQLNGILGSIRWHGNGTLIGTLVSGIVVKGPMAKPTIGGMYRFTGAVETHPKYGDQFAFVTYTATVPTDGRAFQSYLEQNAKWIGPIKAREIVEKYGEDAVRICREDPERVARDITGISRARALEISTMLYSIEKNEAVELEVRGILVGTGLGNAVVARIVERYGADAARLIRENPYRLIDDIDGIGFLRADVLALKIGYARGGAFRLRAGIRYVLAEAASVAGHVCLPIWSLVEETAEILGVEKPLVVSALESAAADGKIESDAGFVYLPNLWADERSTAASIKGLIVDAPPLTVRVDLKLHADQAEAIAKAARNSVFVLTGAPGTGKTYTIQAIAASVLSHGGTVELAAPTGKAAKRIEEQSGMEARTVHRLLEAGMYGNSFQFGKDKQNQIDADMIIIDETSMLDTSLASRLLEAIRPGTRLVFVGDVNQLPSVGPGNVLGQLIASGHVPFTELTSIKRQNPGLIIQNCHAIKYGRPLELREDWTRDFVFLEREGLEAIGDEIEMQVKRLVDRDVQVIVPMRERTSLSANSLNDRLREVLNPAPQWASGKDWRFRAGDKVIQTRNNYELEIMNGDVGRVISIEPSRGIIVAFDGKTRDVAVPIHGNALELAYALTCHKFQGSEARVVIVPVCRSFGPMVAQRNWLYTACSRARELLILVGERAEVAKIVARDRPVRRFTRLARMISEKGGVYK